MILALRAFIIHALGSAWVACSTPAPSESCASNPDDQEGANKEKCLLQNSAEKRKIYTHVFEEEDAFKEGEETLGVTGSSPEIPNSDRTGATACTCATEDCVGETCDFSCDEGFYAVGKHVYRKAYVAQGITLISEGFFGGRCDPICTEFEPCSSSQVPFRFKNGDCMKHVCAKATSTPSVGSGSAEDEALLALARGNWALWQIGRSSTSGLYVDNINKAFQPSWGRAKADVTGCGLIMECIAVGLGFQTKSEAQTRILQTLKALSGEVSAVSKISTAKSTIGKMYAGSLDSSTGAGNDAAGSGNAVATGLLFGGILFAKTYFQRNFPGDEATQEIAKHAVRLFEDVEWDKMICGSSDTVESMTGQRVAWDVRADGTCSNTAKVRRGKLQFNEHYVGRWLAYEWACRVKKTDSCSNLQSIWNAQQTIRQEPNSWTNSASSMGTWNILSNWGSYVVQLPYFMANPFNADPDFVKLFKSSWKAEKDFYAHAPYYAPDRYGLGAGPTKKDCAGTGYIADRLTAPGQCLTYSPHGTVGYLATGDPQAKKDVLKMLADGEAVTMVRDPKDSNMYPVLDRRMLLDQVWRPYAITMIDMAGELFGLGAYFLGNEFFTENTNFFDDPQAPWVSAA